VGCANLRDFVEGQCGLEDLRKVAPTVGQVVLVASLFSKYLAPLLGLDSSRLRVRSPKIETCCRCTNTLHLPSYDTKDELREALTEAIEGSAGIFELE